MPVSAAANASDAATLLPSPTNTTRRPRARRTCSRSVSRSASAWHGWARSDSRLTTGTSTAAAMRSSTRVVEHPGRDQRAVAGEGAGDVLGRLPRVDPDLLGPDVDRVPAEPDDRHLGRRPGAGRRLLEQQGDDAVPVEDALGTRAGSAFHASARSSTAASWPGRGRRPRGSRSPCPPPCSSRLQHTSRGSRPPRRSRRR